MIRKNRIKKRLFYKNIWVISSSIACGKSSFIKILKNFNFCVESADEISAKIFIKKIKKIKKKLKIKDNNFLNLSLSEQKAMIANIIFNDKFAKKRLEKIMHPAIKKDILLWAKKQKQTSFIEIPLFFENKNYRCFYNTVVVFASGETALKRLMKRNNLNEIEAKKRINSQLDVETKVKLATFVINNDKDFENLENESEKFINKILKN